MSTTTTSNRLVLNPPIGHSTWRDAGWSHIVDPETGRAPLVHDAIVESISVRAVVDPRTQRFSEMRFDVGQDGGEEATARFESGRLAVERGLDGDDDA